MFFNDYASFFFASNASSTVSPDHEQLSENSYIDDMNCLTWSAGRTISVGSSGSILLLLLEALALRLAFPSPDML